MNNSDKKGSIKFGNKMEEEFLKGNPICIFVRRQDKRNHNIKKNHIPNILEINLSLHDVLESFLKSSHIVVVKLEVILRSMFISLWKKMLEVWNKVESIVWVGILPFPSLNEI